MSIFPASRTDLALYYVGEEWESSWLLNLAIQDLYLSLALLAESGKPSKSPANVTEES